MSDIVLVNRDTLINKIGLYLLGAYVLVGRRDG